MKVRGLDKSMARLRQIAPNVDAALDAAQEKSAQEFVSMAKSLAPHRTGDYQDSINAKPVKDAEVGSTRTFTYGSVKAGTRVASAWGIFASWIWHFLEFGTVDTTAQPHMLPTMRLLQKRIRGRLRRAVNKAVKDALKS